VCRSGRACHCMWASLTPRRPVADGRLVTQSHTLSAVSAAPHSSLVAGRAGRAFVSSQHSQPGASCQLTRSSAGRRRGRRQRRGAVGGGAGAARARAVRAVRRAALAAGRAQRARACGRRPAASAHPDLESYPRTHPLATLWSLSASRAAAPGREVQDRARRHVSQVPACARRARGCTALQGDRQMPWRMHTRPCMSLAVVRMCSHVFAYVRNCS